MKPGFGVNLCQTGAHIISNICALECSELPSSRQVTQKGSSLQVYNLDPQSDPMLKVTANGISLSLLVQPNGRKSEVLGIHGDTLKIRIQAPPVEGKANEVVVEFLAEFFGVGRRQVTLVQGQQSRHKVVEITGLSIEEAQRKIAHCI